MPTLEDEYDREEELEFLAGLAANYDGSRDGLEYEIREWMLERWKYLMKKHDHLIASNDYDYPGVRLGRVDGQLKLIHDFMSIYFPDDVPHLPDKLKPSILNEDFDVILPHEDTTEFRESD